MKKETTNYYIQCVSLLKELKTRHPSYTLGRHLSTALEEYGDIWGTPDKEILFALTKYKAQLEMDVPQEEDDKELEKIIKDGMNLSSVYEEDEEEDY